MGKRWDRGDYCDIIPDTIFGVCLKGCCYEHDLSYWKHDKTRKQADKHLKNCVIWEFSKKKKRFLGLIIGNTMYFFVRLLGKLRY